MIGTRYEGYYQKEDKLPFFMNLNLERTPKTLSKEQNWHEELEIQFCEGGQGSVLLDGERLELCEGDVAIVNPNVIHYTGTEERLVYSCVIINCDFLARVGVDCKQLRFEPLVKSTRVSFLLQALKAEYKADDELRIPKLHRAFLELMIELAEHYSKKVLPIQAQSRAFENVRGAVKYIRENYGARLTLDALSASLRADKYALCRDFKRLTGQTIIEYTNSYRCQRAAQLISEGATVAEAAAACGFENMSFFTRCFKKNTSRLPSSYKISR